MCLRLHNRCDYNYVTFKIVKEIMKNRSGEYGKTRKTLPLEGGGKRVGVKGLTGTARRLRKHSTDTERYL